MARSKQRQRKKRPASGCVMPQVRGVSGAYPARVAMPSSSCRRRQPEDVLTKCWQWLA